MGKGRKTMIIAGRELFTKVVEDLIGRHAWFEVSPVNEPEDNEWHLSVRAENADLYAKDYPDVGYLMDGGLKCPACESDNIEGIGGGFDIDGMQASNNMQCMDCFTAWSDIYKLAGFMER